MVRLSLLYRIIADLSLIHICLQEPVYNDGGDALYVMDQLSDKKNKEEKWVEDLALEAAMEHLGEREKYIRCV